MCFFQIFRMNQYIEAIPYGSIVAVTVNDAMKLDTLTDEQRKGLDSLGGEACLNGNYLTT